MATPDYSTHDPRGWCGDPKRGAAMGRGTYEGDRDFAGRIYLRRVYLDQGGYDRNGTYFGHGAPLYWCASEDDPNDGITIDRMLRAGTRAQAVAQVRAWYPKAKVRP